MSDVATPREVPVEEKYAAPTTTNDPNMPINPDDPNDKIRAEGPEVADPAQAAAKVLFDEAAAANPEAMEEGADRTAITGATGPNSGAAKVEAKTDES